MPKTVPDFWLNVGDTGPAIQATLKDAAGAVVDLTGASVHFRMAPIVTSAAAIDAAATTVGSPTLGVVAFAWRTGDTAVAGDYDARWRVTYANGVVESFPDDDTGPLLVRIKAAP